MHRDEAFGAVEKPIKTQCEKMHTEIRTQMWRGMRYFLLCFVYPIVVGVPSVYITGRLRPKTGGVIGFYDFSNTPTAKFCGGCF